MYKWCSHGWEPGLSMGMCATETLHPLFLKCIACCLCFSFIFYFLPLSILCMFTGTRAVAEAGSVSVSERTRCLARTAAESASVTARRTRGETGTRSTTKRGDGEGMEREEEGGDDRVLGTSGGGCAGFVSSRQNTCCVERETIRQP